MKLAYFVSRYLLNRLVIWSIKSSLNFSFIYLFIQEMLRVSHELGIEDKKSKTRFPPKGFDLDSEYKLRKYNWFNQYLFGTHSLLGIILQLWICSNELSKQFPCLHGNKQTGIYHLQIRIWRKIHHRKRWVRALEHYSCHRVVLPWLKGAGLLYPCINKSLVALLNLDQFSEGGSISEPLHLRNGCSDALMGICIGYHRVH